METVEIVETIIQLLSPLYPLRELSTVFEAERVFLRPFTLKDFSQLYQVYGNLQVMRYVGKGARTPLETLAELIGFINDWSKHGFGPMAVIHKQTGKLIGRSGVSPNPRSPFPQLGYVLHSDYHGQGLGTEVAKASLTFAFQQLKVQRVEAFSRLKNQASCHILSQKLGMKLETKNFQYQGRIFAKYSISLAAYLAQTSGINKTVAVS